MQALVGGDQAVAVEYAGCEMHVVDSCVIHGKYAWRPTTVATDTVEINSADELFGKLPIGAVSLEADLKRSGRLAVRTTVSGQLRAAEVSTADVPREGACARVTHVIQAVSIGAYKLIAGGSTAASGGVSVGSIGGGGSLVRQEETLREAGDPATCGNSNAEGAPAACSSPIQVFLEPVQRNKTEEERRIEGVDKAAMRQGAVQMTLSLGGADTSARWTLRDERGATSCALPCTRWVPPASGYYVQRDEALSGGLERVDVPRDLPFATGSAVDATVAPAHGSRGLPWLVIVPSGLAVAGGVALVGIGMQLKHFDCFYADGSSRTTSASSTGSGPDSCRNGVGPQLAHFATLDDHTLVTAGAIIGVAGIVGVAGGLFWFLSSDGGHLDMRPMGTAAATRPRSRITYVGPDGIGGQF